MYLSETLKKEKSSIQVLPFTELIPFTRTSRLCFFVTHVPSHETCFCRKWHTLCCDLYGPEHPRTKRPTTALQEPTYRRIAQERGDKVPGIDQPHTGMLTYCKWEQQDPIP